MVHVAIVGGSGFVGGELSRLLLAHPEVTKLQVTSESRAGKPLGTVHPNLRHHTDQAFIRKEDLNPCDVIFLAMPHGAAASEVSIWQNKATVVIDLSSDFRLNDMALYERYYGGLHTATHLCSQFTPGIPEFYRNELRSADRIAGPGCTAIAGILALRPLRASGVIEPRVYVDSKVGSSGSGARVGLGTHHPLRSGVTRVFKPTGHRHEAEIVTQCDVIPHVTVNSVDMVRGILLTAFCTLSHPVSDRDIRKIFREAYADEPFTRLVKRQGQAGYTLPEPKILTGTNYCDIGYALTDDGSGLIAISALDNLMKGAVGNAIHCMNIRMQFPETAGLTSISLHPV
ncbi:N-acetyl-gamma-glutamyl-phosphate reductase [Ruegeria atlantica]|uniref:N-acetyl-gamma-glutamyl-phosphate reductase n=1 Tax=Ruegeria atlantica TaxID=81569 RepID=UPI0014812E41|nr:N-acetyl-gamma-glutamyl-phosphate reductase [Ruegeria atlantica]